MDVFCVSSFFCLHNSDWVQWVLCLISMPHSMMLLLFLQCCWLLIRGEMKSELLMDVICVSSFVFTTQIESRECCVWFQWLTQWCCSCVSNAIVCWWEEKGKEWIVDGCLLCVFFCHHCSNRVEWVLCLISMIHSTMLLLFLQSCFLFVWRERKRVICWWISFACLLSFVFTTQIEFSECCVWFQCITQWCCSSVSNLVICLCEGKRKEWTVDGCLWCVFFCLHYSDRVQWVLRWPLIIHTVTLLLWFQYRCLLMWIEKEKSELLMDFFCVPSFFCNHVLYWVQWVLCLISVHHIMILLLFL